MGDILTRLQSDIAFRLRLQAKVSNLYEIHHPHMIRVPTIYEEAADEIERLRKVTAEQPPIFLKAGKTLSRDACDALRNRLKGIFGDRKVLVLEDGLDLVNPQEWRPESIYVNCGTFSLTTNPLGLDSISVDGVELKNVASTTVEVKDGYRPVVRIEILPDYSALEHVS